MSEKTIADKLGKEHKAVSVAEFFEKNRHLLGFGSKRQALLTVIKESIDNSLDACEEAKTLPDLKVVIKKGDKDDRLIIVIEDNGPGIIRDNLHKAFGKLLYGSKFHGNKQGRGQQGIGITSCVLYSQLTTGKSSKIISKISDNKVAHFVEIMLDTKLNEPKILKEGEDKRFNHRGTKIELEILAEYIATGRQSVKEYLKRTSIVNPHSRITFIDPDKKKIVFNRTTAQLPKLAKRIKPHPDGIELGTLIKMLANSNKGTVKSFLQSDFSSIGSKTADEIIQKAEIEPRVKPTLLQRTDVEKLLHGIESVNVQAPPLDCLSPIGENYLLKSLKTGIEAEFYATITRKPTAYRGMPFQIEVGISYGGNLPMDGKGQIMRFANKVPLVYEDYACAITQGVKKTAWKRYGIESIGDLPKGPIVVVIHMASVWVPFTSEGKQAIASYPAVIKEMKLGLMDAARKLQIFLRKKFRAAKEAKKVNTFVLYMPEIAYAISEISGAKEEKVLADVRKLLVKNYGEEAIKKEQ